MAIDYSGTWQDRMRTEYNDLVERMNGLDNMLHKWDNGEIDFIPNCPYYILRQQLITMRYYADILEARFKIEGVPIIVHNNG